MIFHDDEMIKMVLNGVQYSPLKIEMKYQSPYVYEKDLNKYEIYLAFERSCPFNKQLIKQFKTDNNVNLKLFNNDLELINSFNRVSIKMYNVDKLIEFNIIAYSV